MAQYGIAHFAVTHPDFDRPIGVISTLDIARAIAAEPDPEPRDDGSSSPRSEVAPDASTFSPEPALA